eukprot:14097436-Heterocapsa_arctica.AAC.1
MVYANLVICGALRTTNAHAVANNKRNPLRRHEFALSCAVCVASRWSPLARRCRMRQRPQVDDAPLRAPALLEPVRRFKPSKRFYGVLY